MPSSTLRADYRRFTTSQPIEAWNYWFCIPTGDQHGIMAILGLTAPRPATFALGASVIEGATHGDDAGLVFITPKTNGWTAVIGPCDPSGIRDIVGGRSALEPLVDPGPPRC